jgi:hypothetical protein
MAEGSNNLKELTTDEVTRVCRAAVRGTDCHYIGTFAAWQGPDTDEFLEEAKELDAAFVANTDVVEKEGTHWCLFFLPADLTEPAYLFDSFGRLPTSMGRMYWSDYMKTITEKRRERYGSPIREWAFNNNVVQDPNTAVCGQLCAMTLFSLCRDKPLFTHVVPLHVVDKFMETYGK